MNSVAQNRPLFCSVSLCVAAGDSYDRNRSCPLMAICGGILKGTKRMQCSKPAPGRSSYFQLSVCSYKKDYGRMFINKVHRRRDNKLTQNVLGRNNC